MVLKSGNTAIMTYFTFFSSKKQKLHPYFFTNILSHITQSSTTLGAHFNFNKKKYLRIYCVNIKLSYCANKIFNIINIININRYTSGDFVVFESSKFSLSCRLLTSKDSLMSSDNFSLMEGVSKLTLGKESLLSNDMQKSSDF